MEVSHDLSPEIPIACGAKDYIREFPWFYNDGNPKYVDFESEEEIEQSKEVGLNNHDHHLEKLSDNHQYEYEYDASGYVVGCRAIKKGESKHVKSDSTSHEYDAKADGDDYDVDAKSESSVDLTKKVPWFDHQLESCCDSEYSYVFEVLESEADRFEYDDYGYVVGYRVNKDCESEQVQSHAACHDYDVDGKTGDFVIEEAQEVVFDNFDMLKDDISEENNQELRPNLKRKATDVDIGEEQMIVLALMVPQLCPWRDNKGQLKKRLKSLKH